MSASQRRKGRAFEQLIARTLRDAGFPCRRGRQGEGPVEPDIVLDPPGRLGGITPWIECGHGARMSLRAKYGQAVRQSRVGTTPVAVVRRDRWPILAMLTAAGLVAAVGRDRVRDVRVMVADADTPCRVEDLLTVADMEAIGDVPVVVEWRELLNAVGRCRDQ